MSPSPAALPVEEYDVPGLAQDVEILTDEWGVPHIYAQERLDAFVAQGFQAARDRLFQIDLWRRRGLGQLAEVFGPDHIKQDQATRSFLYRGDMRAEWLAYNTATKDVVTAFVTGVNAFVDWALQQPADRLPPEFAALGYEPAYWAPEDIARIRTHGLLYNAEQELARALTLRDLGAAAEEMRSVRESDNPLEIPEPGLYDALTDAVLDVYRLAFAPVTFVPATSTGTPAEPTSASTGPGDADVPPGSNNWVITPSRSGTGRPLLANDPHRAVTVPSLRYLAHLQAPDLNVIGAGEPFLPGISIGHNEHVAFGLTIWPVDHEDIYVYELHPDDDGRYRYNGDWEAFTVVEETAAVAGESPTVHRLTFSRHGPVIFVDSAARRAVAIQAVWLQPGMAPYLASLEYQSARSSAEFRKALRRWGAPGVNQVFASDDGDTGWQASALVPRRPGWDSALPVPGDGRYEWDGFAMVEELPAVHNPQGGWFSSSNENNLPADFDNNALTITTDWYSTARHERLTTWFDSDDTIDVDSSIAKHTDAMNLHGRQLLDSLAKVTVSGDGADEWSELQQWDGVERADSRAPLLYQVWQRRHLRPWLVDHCLERLGVAPDAIAAGRHRLLRADTLFSDLRPDLWMVRSFNQDNDDDRALLHDGVATTFRAALADIEQRLGSDRAGWTWGDLHKTVLRHSVFSTVAASSVPDEWGTLPAVPRHGSGDTVGLAGHDDTYNAVMGSSFRMAVDVGEWDQSRWLNSPGQSGDPRSPHYADLLPLWAEGRSFPMVFSRAAVENAARDRAVLRASTAKTGGTA